MTELMRLRLDLLELLLARRDHLVPSTGQRVTLQVMTVAELKEVLGGPSGKRPKAAGPFDHLIAQARGSANKTIESIQWMIQHKHAVSQELVEDIHDDLAQALSALEEAFGLEADE